jgi:hypothetical protein
VTERLQFNVSTSSLSDHQKRIKNNILYKTVNNKHQSLKPKHLQYLGSDRIGLDPISMSSIATIDR